MGYQIIWSILSKRIDVDVRRLFTDQQEYSHRSIDLFGLSLSWELDGPILLELLEQQNIPLWSHQRTEKDPIVFGGGPVLTANPEPFAPFLDVVLLGDGEELVSRFIDIVHDNRHLSRADQLKALAQSPGIYVPSFYIPSYSPDGTLQGITPSQSDIPNFIAKQTWTSKVLNHSQVITPDSAWPNIHMIEMVRSCPELCRFCLASYLTLPFRSSSIEEGLIPAVEKGISFTKRIGLLGASVTQHPQFLDLLHWLDQDRFNDLRLSVSSVRASTVSLEMTKILSKRGCNSITMAIESGSERMRQVVNKKLTEEEIFKAVRYAEEGGLKSLKFYGIVGLPQENEADIEATANLLIKLKAKTSQLRFILGVSTFVPKGHTPFQWYGVLPEAEKRLKLLSKTLKPKGIDVRPESFGWSVIQALLSRSDRRLAPVIASMRGRHSSLGNWKKAYKAKQERIDSELNDGKTSYPALPEWKEIIHEQWATSKVLPWMHLQGPLKPDSLKEHLNHALQESH